MVKIIIVGDSGVGKTNIISRFCCREGEQGDFKDYHVATIGVDFSTKILQLDNARLKLQIWDTAGQERFKTITETYYKGAAGIILVYAVDSEETFLNIGKESSM
jgi:Ras-related protein Rab-8A